MNIVMIISEMRQKILVKKEHFLKVNSENKRATS